MDYTITEEQFESLKKLSRDLRPDLDLIDVKADIWKLIHQIESRAKEDVKREQTGIDRKQEEFDRTVCSELENYLVPPENPDPSLNSKMVGVVEDVSKYMETKLTRMDRNAFIRRLISKTLAARKKELQMAMVQQKHAVKSKVEIENAISDLESIFQG
jgi:hypothetical protein